MKIYAPILALIMVMLLFACESWEVSVKKPAIKYVSFAGYPVTATKFDPDLRTITLQIPAVLPDDGLIPAFGLSENAKIVQGITPTGKLDLSLIDVSIRSEDANREIEVIVSNQAKTDSTTYRVVLVQPAGCPTSLMLSTASNYIARTNSEGNTEFHLPLKNAYQNFQIRSVRFTELTDGGVRKTYEIDPATNPGLFRYDDDFPNELVTSYGPIPGKYRNWNEISMTTDCNTDRIVFFRYY